MPRRSDTYPRNEHSSSSSEEDEEKPRSWRDILRRIPHRISLRELLHGTVVPHDFVDLGITNRGNCLFQFCREGLDEETASERLAYVRKGLSENRDRELVDLEWLIGSPCKTSLITCISERKKIMRRIRKMKIIKDHDLLLDIFVEKDEFSQFAERNTTVHPAITRKDDSESGEERRGGIGAKDGFRYRKDWEQDFPSYIPAASYPEIRTYSITDRFERVSVKTSSNAHEELALLIPPEVEMSYLRSLSDRVSRSVRNEALEKGYAVATCHKTVDGTHRSQSNCIENCVSGPSGNPLCIDMSLRRAVLYCRSPEPPGSGKWFGIRPVGQKRRGPMNVAPSSPVYLARRSCNEREELIATAFQKYSSMEKLFVLRHQEKSDLVSLKLNIQFRLPICNHHIRLSETEVTSIVFELVYLKRNTVFIKRHKAYFPAVGSDAGGIITVGACRETSKDVVCNDCKLGKHSFHAISQIVAPPIPFERNGESRSLRADDELISPSSAISELIFNGGNTQRVLEANFAAIQFNTDRLLLSKSKLPVLSQAESDFSELKGKLATGYIRLRQKWACTKDVTSGIQFVPRRWDRSYDAGLTRDKDTRQRCEVEAHVKEAKEESCQSFKQFPVFAAMFQRTRFTDACSCLQSYKLIDIDNAMRRAIDFRENPLNVTGVDSGILITIREEASPIFVNAPHAFVIAPDVDAILSHDYTMIFKFSHCSRKLIISAPQNGPFVRSASNLWSPTSKPVRAFRSIPASGTIAILDIVPFHDSSRFRPPTPGLSRIADPMGRESSDCEGFNKRAGCESVLNERKQKKVSQKFAPSLANTTQILTKMCPNLSQTDMYYNDIYYNAVPGPREYFWLRMRLTDKPISRWENFNVRCTAVLHIALQYLYYGLLRLHELLKHRMAFHAAGLFRLIISQEEPLLDGQYITVRPDLKQDTGFLVARAIRETRMRYEKYTERRKGEERVEGKESITCYACKIVSRTWARPRNDRCHDKIESLSRKNPG
ncbi:hypothetical protein EAG_07706 [Camponotus floridanus]|uniref:Uncharacterized protein n=1 Tax=Camponotus floridanus TaxID=104421 RepID=E2B1G9_CAMFO|nr:hypothetical protein EAG_07706 [Camponotus floridanus]